MTWPELMGFTMLNAGCDGNAVWVHLPCLREATFGFFMDEEDGEVGGELYCPACGQDCVVIPEDWEDEVRLAVGRQRPPN
jgi:hypothetical protein